MPTARELLEQADALMRRNRAAGQGEGEPRKAADTVTLNTSNISPALVSPRAIALEPISPVARTSLSDAASEAPLPPPSVARRDSDDDVPLLTDAIVDASPAGEVAEIDDVPLLTDAVEEIEVTVVGVDDEEVGESERGESSVWPESGAGDTSVLGRAPDSIASVPDLPEVPQSPPAGRDPLGLDQPAAGFVAPQSALADEAIVDASRASPIDAPVDETIVEISAGSISGTDAVAHEAVREEAPNADVAIPAPIVIRSEADEARIREIAEEIGMQVLQRIDIFTDTGLREKVGERLKPVVERVSAELVDALNQHVGELLRAYVAEAIEREIETWRTRK
ncbi:MAG TPA: hypothetical protein VNG69_01400 [Casimicrobiaceae bacterium]|nr:hypothetical protein [Casimicrobiaceae bacterium]